MTTRLTEVLGCRHPIISAGMGGPARSELAAAVSEAGGFGLLGMVRESPGVIAREIADVRRRTAKPFGVNLVPFATNPALLADELAVCLDARVPAMCFFCDVHPAIVEQAKGADCLVLYQVGTLEDAVLAQSAGADVVIVQGVEAGDFEQMCLHAGESSAQVTGIRPAAAIIDAMMREATAALGGVDTRAVAP
jgi:nitronate monooxygenase